MAKEVELLNHFLAARDLAAPRKCLYSRKTFLTSVLVIV